MIRHMSPGRSADPQHDAQHWPVAVAALLTFGAGAIDIVALVHLGGGFASVMTGMALMGLGMAVPMSRPSFMPWSQFCPM